MCENNDNEKINNTKTKRNIILIILAVLVLLLSLLLIFARPIGMRINADYEFISAIESSILNRMETTSDDNFDRAIVVNTELAYLEKFADADFYLPENKELVNKYIDGLKMQKEALNEQKKSDYQLKWQQGIVVRYEVLGELYAKYNFLKDNAKFVGTYISGLEEQKHILNAYETIEKDIESQKKDEDLAWSFDGYTMSCTVKNNTEYTYSTEYELLCYDENNTLCDTEYCYIESIKPDSSYKVSFYITDAENLSYYEWNNYYTEVK